MCTLEGKTKQYCSGNRYGHKDIFLKKKKAAPLFPPLQPPFTSTLR